MPSHGGKAGGCCRSVITRACSSIVDLHSPRQHLKRHSMNLLVGRLRFWPKSPPSKGQWRTNGRNDILFGNITFAAPHLTTVFLTVRPADLKLSSARSLGLKVQWVRGPNCFSPLQPTFI